MATWVINSESALQSLVGDMRELFGKHKYLKVSAKTGKARSLDQNAISHVWYEQVAREIKDDDVLGWNCFCKLHFGIPILRAEDEGFKAFYDGSLKGLSYEQKLQAMKYLPVTSIMTKPQFNNYLDTMQSHFLERGVALIYPESEQ
jgi:hypothetical protein